MILGNADAYLKQSITLLKELKEADIKLRSGFHFSNDFIGILLMSIMANKMILSKVINFLSIVQAE